MLCCILGSEGDGRNYIVHRAGGGGGGERGKIIRPTRDTCASTIQVKRKRMQRENYGEATKKV